METTANALAGVRTASEFTDLLQAWRHGDQDAMDALMPLVYDELHRLARAYMRDERAGHTLQPTALLHEAWLRLTEQRELDWTSRAHFVALAATMMRRVLLNYARDRRAAKRRREVRLQSSSQGALRSSPPTPQGALRIELCEAIAGREPAEIVELDDALKRLARLEPRLGKVVELRVFGGFSVEEAARYLGLSTATLKRDWRLAKAWLRREMKR